MLGGDGRYFNREAAQLLFEVLILYFLNTQCCNIFVLSTFHIGNSTFRVYDQCFGTVMQIIIKIAAGNGVGKILVGK